MADIARFVDKAYEGMDFAELVKQPIAALQGVSDKDGELLREAFGIKTIGDLATNKFFLRAQAIAALS